MGQYDENGLIEAEACHFCGNTDLELFRTVFTPPSLGAEFCGGAILMMTMSSFVKCTKCGLLIQSPRMTDERIKQYYTTDLYWSTIGRDEEILRATEINRADSLHAFLIRHEVKFKTHLDMGAGFGYFIGTTEKYFHAETEGYDLKNNPTEKPNKKYDLVSSTHCLEHVPYPKDELALYRSLANEYLLLEVPPYATAGNLYGLRFSHLYCFPVDVLVKMIEDAGFKILVADVQNGTRILAEVVK
jgi:hypothetical protein